MESEQNKQIELKSTPEQTLKGLIIGSAYDMIQQESRMMRYKRLNGSAQINHIADFSSSIIIVWGLVKNMIDANKIYSMDDKYNDFEFVNDLEFDKVAIHTNLYKLLRAKSYIMFSLHKLGLMNILNNQQQQNKAIDVR